MNRLGHTSSFKSSPSTSHTSFSSASRSSPSTSTAQPAPAPRTGSPSAPRSPSRSDSFETRSPQHETAPKSPTAQDGDGWETAGSKKKPRVQRPADPDRQYNQKLNDIHQSLDTSVNRKGHREYGEVQVPRSDLRRLHQELTQQYHNKPIPGTNGREQFYVTRQDFHKKGGGFNITAHDISQSGKDKSKGNGQPSWLNLHVVP